MKLFGVVGANNDVQFMYDCYDVVDILANITIVTCMLWVEAGLRALDSVTLPFDILPLGNKLVNLMIYEILPLLAGTLSIHWLLHTNVVLVVTKLL